ALLELAPLMSSLIGDKSYDGDGFRAEIVDRGAKPVIPNKSNRVVLHSFSKRAYKGRNVIERCFCRLKDFRRVATRYDKLARNFLAALSVQIGMNECPHDGRRTCGHALARQIDHSGLPAAQRREILFGQMMMQIRVGDDPRRHRKGANTMGSMMVAEFGLKSSTGS